MGRRLDQSNGRVWMEDPQARWVSYDDLIELARSVWWDGDERIPQGTGLPETPEQAVELLEAMKTHTFRWVD